MKRFVFVLAVAFTYVCAVAPFAAAQEKGQGPPPAGVVMEKAESGTVRPRTDFVGTVYFPEVSEVAAEVAGRVSAVPALEGDRLTRGNVLVEISTDLLYQQLQASEADYERILSSLENAETDFARKKELFETGSISENEFDQARYTLEGLEKQANARLADVRLLRLKMDKTMIRAPFDGIVLDTAVDRGEWISIGSTAAVVARDDSVEVRVEVPQEVLAHVKPGMEVEVRAVGKRFPGTIAAVILQGNEVTRTFPIKIEVQNSVGLAQGMEAEVGIPSGPEVQAVLVPRDAVIPVRGQQAVWTNKEGTANMVPVQVLAFMGMKAAVQGPGLAAGAQVVTKGNERLRPGQPIVPAKGPGPMSMQQGQGKPGAKPQQAEGNPKEQPQAKEKAE